jgi:hypothetical protein
VLVAAGQDVPRREARVAESITKVCRSPVFDRIERASRVRTLALLFAAVSNQDDLHGAAPVRDR